MQTPADYIAQIPEDRQPYVQKLHDLIVANLPEGFTDCINYGMIGYVVPKTVYPAGYHCDTKLPLPFAGLASQKNSVNFYHMAIYADATLYDWFVLEYTKHCKAKLDMGKSCIRFKKMEDIPFELIAELIRKISVSDWITLYEGVLKK
jgi:uncharacterized protein YdhG (YjbR/CyaY superfamily)